MNGQLIMNAVIKEAEAKEAKALANLQNYMTNAAGIGEHPDVVEECMKLVIDIADAAEVRETVKKLIETSQNNQQQSKE